MQKNSYFICDKSTGAVLFKTTSDNVVPAPDTQIKLPCDPGDSPDDFFLDDGNLVFKGIMSEGVLSSGEFTVALPVGTVALWQGETYTVNDGALSVTVDQPGTYKLTVLHPQYKTRDYIIEN